MCLNKSGAASATLAALKLARITSPAISQSRWFRQPLQRLHAMQAFLEDAVVSPDDTLNYADYEFALDEIHQAEYVCEH